MDFTLTQEQEQFRRSTRSVLNTVVDTDMRQSVVRTGVAHDKRLARALADEGLLSQAAPGPDRDPVLLHLLFSEMEKAGAPYEGLAVNLLVAGVLDTVGSDMHRKLVVGPLLSGDKNVCLGYSEPEAGSDLAAVRTRSRRTADGWAINGQKLWTTLAQDADWMFTMTSTDSRPSEVADQPPGHRRATMFLVPMDSDGIRVDRSSMMQP